MPRPKIYKCRELIKLLQEHDKDFSVIRERGKGSERMIYHPNVNGVKRSYPLPCHGDGATVRRGHLAAIRRRFELPDDFFK